MTKLNFSKIPFPEIIRTNLFVKILVSKNKKYQKIHSLRELILKKLARDAF